MADPTPHERKVIRNAVVAQIVDATTAAAERVYASREKPWRPVELPGIAVRTLKESAARENLDGGLVRTLTLSVLAIVSVTERNDDAVDALVLQVEQAIDADTTFGGKAQDAILTETELDITDAQGNAIGAAILTYEVEYHTAPRT